MNIDPRLLALVLARGRVVFGLAALVFPGLTARLVLGTNGRGTRALLRMVGIRDVALGVGAITNLKEVNQDAEWVSMGALADGGDSVAFLLAPLGWRRAANGVFAGAAAALGLWCARTLADRRAPVSGEREPSAAASSDIVPGG
jgi:uncharacterized protein YjeT (DUF2065 family)